jgi:hypothetical protein
MVFMADGVVGVTCLGPGWLRPVLRNPAEVVAGSAPLSRAHPPAAELPWPPFVDWTKAVVGKGGRGILPRGARRPRTVGFPEAHPGVSAVAKRAQRFVRGLRARRTKDWRLSLRERQPQPPSRASYRVRCRRQGRSPSALPVRSPWPWEEFIARVQARRLRAVLRPSPRPRYAAPRVARSGLRTSCSARPRTSARGCRWWRGRGRSRSCSSDRVAAHRRCC